MARKAAKRCWRANNEVIAQSTKRVCRARTQNGFVRSSVLQPTD
jgi:hypothetical protein